MSKKVNKARPWSYRVPVHLEGRLEARAEAAGLSVGKWTERLVLEALTIRENSTQPEAYTDMGSAPDWRDAQLPPGDRMGADDGNRDDPTPPDDATQNLAFSEACNTSSEYDATHDEEIEIGRTDERDAVAENDGEGGDDLPKASQSSKPVDGRIPGPADTAIGDQERPGCPGCGGTGLLNPGIDGTACPDCADRAEHGRIGSDHGGRSGDLPGDGGRTPARRPIEDDDRTETVPGLRSEADERRLVGMTGITPDAARQARIEALTNELTQT